MTLEGRLTVPLPILEAGTVEVRLTPAGDLTEVEVAYTLTALTSEGGAWLADFAAH